jgi:hypothetical protein
LSIRNGQAFFQLLSFTDSNNTYLRIALTQCYVDRLQLFQKIVFLAEMSKRENMQFTTLLQQYGMTQPIKKIIVSVNASGDTLLKYALKHRLAAVSPLLDAMNALEMHNRVKIITRKGRDNLNAITAAATHNVQGFGLLLSVMENWFQGNYRFQTNARWSTHPLLLIVSSEQAIIEAVLMAFDSLNVRLQARYFSCTDRDGNHLFMNLISNNPRLSNRVLRQFQKLPVALQASIICKQYKNYHTIFTYAVEHNLSFATILIQEVLPRLPHWDILHILNTLTDTGRNLLTLTIEFNPALVALILNIIDTQTKIFMTGEDPFMTSIANQWIESILNIFVYKNLLGENAVDIAARCAPSLKPVIFETWEKYRNLYLQLNPSLTVADLPDIPSVSLEPMPPEPSEPRASLEYGDSFSGYPPFFDYDNFSSLLAPGFFNSPRSSDDENHLHTGQSSSPINE